MSLALAVRGSCQMAALEPIHPEYAHRFPLSLFVSTRSLTTRTPQMTVDLPPQVEAVIRQRIESGPYRTAGEVIQEALLALEERDRLNDLRKKLQTGIDQLDSGEGIAFTPKWRVQRRLIAARRAAAGDIPNPDVCP